MEKSKTVICFVYHKSQFKSNSPFKYIQKWNNPKQSFALFTTKVSLNIILHLQKEINFLSLNIIKNGKIQNSHLLCLLQKSV